MDIFTDFQTYNRYYDKKSTTNNNIFYSSNDTSSIKDNDINSSIPIEPCNKSLQDKESLNTDISIVYDIGFLIGSSVVIYKASQLLYYSTKKIYSILPSNFVTSYYKRKRIAIAKTSMEKKLEITDHTYITNLPLNGLDTTNILSLQDSYLKIRPEQHNNGKVSGTVYKFADEDYLEFIMDSYKKFIFSNPLHPNIFPDIRLMEAEIIHMVKSLFHGDSNSCGSITSGRTESIILACKAYRNWKKCTNNISRPEIIISESAHASFHKAADILNLNIVIVPNNKNRGTINTNIIHKYITKNTVCIVGSAPTYAHGVMDDIVELSEIAIKYNIGLHVDCCLGGFLLPFLSLNGTITMLYDFRLEGVTSISVDTHKYGCCLNGSSIILYKNSTLKEFQYFITKEWNGGVYTAPTLAGSRSGSLVATTWASLLYHGINGYTKIAKDILQLKNDLVQSIQKLDDIYIIGEPVTSIIAISSDILDPYEISIHMNNLGWNLNLLHNPRAFQICLTEVHVKKNIKNSFIKDLTNSITKSKNSTNMFYTNKIGLYGTNILLDDNSILGAVANIYMNTLVTIPVINNYEDSAE